MDTRHFYFEVCPLDLIAFEGSPHKPQKRRNGARARAEFQKKQKKHPEPYYCSVRHFTLLFLQTHPTGSGRAEP